MIEQIIESAQVQKNKEDLLRGKRTSEWEEKGGKKVFDSVTQRVIGKENQEKVSLHQKLSAIDSAIERMKKNIKEIPSEREEWESLLSKKEKEREEIIASLRKPPDPKNRSL